MKHVVQIGWVLDGESKAGLFYMKLMYCDNCKTAGHPIRLSRELDDKPIISRKEYKVLTPWPDECPAPEG